jgi:hypothetical protein
MQIEKNEKDKDGPIRGRRVKKEKQTKRNEQRTVYTDRTTKVKQPRSENHLKMIEIQKKQGKSEKSKKIKTNPQKTM